MKLNPYLTFNGQCASALAFYERCLGGKIVMMMTYGDSPIAQQVPVDWKKKIIHATLTPPHPSGLVLNSSQEFGEHHAA